ncbi:MAG: hypothetical protein LC641_11670 [Spirochaeta sp.]|nr:hypothetical protein [Spirochaeta sp.]
MSSATLSATNLNFFYGGLVPVAWVFLEVDPELVDFNVHPAKREVRLRNKKDIHEALVAVIKTHLERNSGIPGVADTTPRQSTPAPGRNAPWTRSYADEFSEKTEWYRTPQPLHTQPFGGQTVAEPYEPPASSATASSFEFLGTVFGVFLLVRMGETLLFLDQHAVHERLIYDELRERPRKQALLVPVEFQTDPEQRDRILSRRPGFAQLGLEIEEVRANTWQITTVPAGFENSPAVLIEVLTDEYDLHERQSAEFFARRACKAAVKDGDRLDGISAEELISRALELKNPRCPHGRPLWFALSKADLFRAVGRTF